MSRVSSKLRDIFIYNEYDTVKETQEPDKSEFVGAMDMDWKDREKSQDQDS